MINTLKACAILKQFTSLDTSHIFPPPLSHIAVPPTAPGRGRSACRTGAGSGAAVSQHNRGGWERGKKWRGTDRMHCAFPVRHRSVTSSWAFYPCPLLLPDVFAILFSTPKKIKPKPKTLNPMHLIFPLLLAVSPLCYIFSLLIPVSPLCYVSRERRRSRWTWRCAPT